MNLYHKWEKSNECSLSLLENSSLGSMSGQFDWQLATTCCMTTCNIARRCSTFNQSEVFGGGWVVIGVVLGGRMVHSEFCVQLHLKLNNIFWRGTFPFVRNLLQQFWYSVHPIHIFSSNFEWFSSDCGRVPGLSYQGLCEPLHPPCDEDLQGYQGLSGGRWYFWLGGLL